MRLLDQPMPSRFLLKIERLSIAQHRSLIAFLYCRPGQWDEGGVPEPLTFWRFVEAPFACIRSLKPADRYEPSSSSYLRWLSVLPSKETTSMKNIRFNHRPKLWLDHLFDTCLVSAFISNWCRDPSLRRLDFSSVAA